MSYLYTNAVSINNSNNVPITANTRLPVDIGNASISISGNVNINTPNVITVASDPENPVHVHLTEIGNSGILTFPYMPVSGNVFIFNSNGSTVVPATALPVSVNNFPVTQNVTFANQTILISGNLAGITANVIVSVNKFNNYLN